MVSEDSDTGTAKKPVGDFAQGIGRVDVSDVRLQANQHLRLRQTEGHGGYGDQSACLNDLYFAESLQTGTPARIADQDRDPMTGSGLGLGQGLDVVFYAP